MQDFAYQFPYTTPIRPKNVKFLTFSLTNAALDIIINSNQTYCFDIEIDINTDFAFVELLRLQYLDTNKLTKINFIKFISIWFNTVIYHYKTLENSQVDSWCQNPKLMLFLCVTCVETVLPPENNNELNKRIIQGFLQRLYYCYTYNSIMPSDLWQELENSQMLISSFLMLNADAENSYMQTLIEQINTKKERIVFTFCKYVIKYLQNTLVPLEPCFANQTGNHILPKNHLTRFSVFPKFFFESDYYKYELKQQRDK